MQHTCPNCRGRMEVPDDASDGLLTCPACGLGFAPDASPTVTMDSAVTDLTRNDDSTGECPKIGRFEILSQIGRGGSGVPREKVTQNAVRDGEIVAVLCGDEALGARPLG